jgi:hypothetical protein
MPVAEISDMLAARRKPSTERDYLQAYFHYAECLSNGELESARMLLRKMNGHGREHDGQMNSEDGFSRTVAAFIREELGYEPQPVGWDALSVDYAIEDPQTGLFGIGIECDAPKHPILATARARELWRPEVLRQAIPVIHRVSSHSWYHDSKGERYRLKQAIAAALAMEDRE